MSTVDVVVERIEEPQNRRSRHTRAALLDAAWKLLGEQGVRRTTMRAVAELAGVSRQALYLHFSSRVELFLALHEHVDEQLDLAGSIQPILDAPDAVVALEEFAGHLARYHPKIRFIDLALLRAQDDDPDVAELIERGTRQWHDFCRHITQRLADEGRLAEPWTADTAADLLWTYMFPETLDRLTGGRGWSTDDYRAHLTLIFRRTLVSV